MEKISENKSFGGLQTVWEHQSDICSCPMRFAVYTPPALADGSADKPVPVLWWLSGLTCTEENFTVKSGFQRYAAEHGLMVVAPDTSPRGTDLPGEHDAYDFGSGAGFYVNATQSPWLEHYNMYSYVTEELPDVVFNGIGGGDRERQGIFGHSMGGHGALVIALRERRAFKSLSAFSPIVAPSGVPWGEKAFSGYLGDNVDAWKEFDATELVKSGHYFAGDILIDQGTADQFLDEQLKPHLFEAACKEVDQPCTIRMQDGYDHSYFFIASFMADHMAHHAKALNG
ncbi:MAG: S-formylglutathione hydrolase [Rhodospirillaceae bacterium]|nr:S-formylglutathione hydrolase [Rhodospirillaceae bacterium]